MRNKYIYLSSLDSNNHADFEVNLPKQLIIAPYSQIRCVSARINPSDNLIEIDDTNDLFYVGIDHWNKLACSVPLLPIQMNKALYNLEDVNSAGLALSQEIEDKLNAQLKSMCLVRDGGAFNVIVFVSSVSRCIRIPSCDKNADLACNLPYVSKSLDALYILY